MAIEKGIEDELDCWRDNDISPFFIFDGCPVKGEDKVSISTGREAHAGTDEAWASYAAGDAKIAVAAFGKNPSTCLKSQIVCVVANKALRSLPSPVTLPPAPVYTEEAPDAFLGFSVQGHCTGTHFSPEPQAKS